MTPDERLLVEAVLASDESLVADLVSRGADPNAQDPSGRTPVSFAAEIGAVGCLRVLLGASGSPNVGDVKGDSAVSYAASTGTTNASRRYSTRVGIGIRSVKGVAAL